MLDSLEVDVITIFPGMLRGFLEESMMGRAAANGLVRFRFIDPRDFTKDVHRSTDDRPYGGGPGMLMKPEPLFGAIESVKRPESRVIMLTPQGERFDQRRAEGLSRERHLIFLCGHYEGVDERVRESLVTDEISIGDYVLTNGAVASAVVIDAVVRLLPGALGGDGATEEESFGRSGLLEYPQYTRPAEFRGMQVPQVLLSGHHAEVARWRQEQAVKRTRLRRPDLMADSREDTRDE
ncbi:MAG: tRNA (guanosine(37)-N1)-methyltransferase TrmD [Lentisphaerae bacterium]|nr:tRNA (guanosine(37)-N1)-methyltransferase TrmD [Lentisphaerota bacterium]